MTQSSEGRQPFLAVLEGFGILPGVFLDTRDEDCVFNFSWDPPEGASEKVQRLWSLMSMLELLSCNLRLLKSQHRRLEALDTLTLSSPANLVISGIVEQRLEAKIADIRREIADFLLENL